MAAEIADAHPRVAGLQLGLTDLFEGLRIDRRDERSVHAAMFAVRLASAEAGYITYSARGHSVELNLAGFDFMGDRYAVIDCPGSLEFCAEIDPALPAVDLAIVVAEPDPAVGEPHPRLGQPQRLAGAEVARLAAIDEVAHARGVAPRALAARLTGDLVAAGGPNVPSAQ